MPLAHGAERLGTYGRDAVPLFFPMLPDDFQHGFAVRGLFEGGAKFGFVEEFGDVRQSVKMFLKLTLRHEKQHDEIHGLIVERIEINAFARAAQGTDNFSDQVRARVRDADAEPNSRAHGRFPLLNHGGDGIVMLGFNFAGGDEIFNQLVDGLPTIGSLQIGDDLLF